MNANHINADSEARREGARQADGKFGTQEHAEATDGLATLAANSVETVDLEDGGGDWFEITPGVIDENAEWVFLHGQCLALAAAASKRTGWPVVAHTFTDYDDGWDKDTDERLSFENLKHAYVQRPDGALLDITGMSFGDTEVLREDLVNAPGERLRVVPAEKVQMLLFEFDGYLVPQDVETADSFVEPMLRRAQEQDGISEDESVGQPVDDHPFWGRSLDYGHNFAGKHGVFL